MRKFNFTLLLGVLATAVSVDAFAADMSEEAGVVPSIQEIQTLATYNTASTIVAGAATLAEKTSRAQQWWLNNINRPYNNVLGSNNGSGVVVGVVDTGAQTTHKSLDGQFAATYNSLTMGSAITDERAHGTMVSGVIAGHIDTDSRYEGVAPGAKLAVYKAFGASASTPNSVIAQGIKWAVDVPGVSVLNLSLGSSSVAFGNELKYATDKNVLVVAAMGNSGTVGAMYPAKYASYVMFNNRIIAVGALTQNNTRSTFSSWDPTVANWTVFAPGTGIYSSYSTPSMYDTWAAMNGTSFAAPMVSGQAALIKSNWNFLTADTTAQIIFKTATRLCSNGGNGLTKVTMCADTGVPDPVFGWGLINVSRSLQPIGNLTLTNYSGTQVIVNGTQLVSSKGGSSAQLTSLSTIGVDSFNRGYMVDLGATVTRALTKTSSTPVMPLRTTTVAGAKFGAAYAYASSSNLHITLSKASFSSSTGSYGGGLGSTSETYFGLQSTGTTPLSLSGEASKFNSPYYNFADSGYHSGYSVAVSDTSVLRAGVMSSGNNLPGAVVGTIELQKKFGNDVVVIAAGNMQETRASLGMHGTGALGMSADTSTRFITSSGSKEVAVNTYVSAMMSAGITSEYTNNDNSLISGGSAVYSQAWSLGIAQKSLFRHNDSLGFTVSMPLRTMRGSVNVTTATSQSQLDGSLEYLTQGVTLAPTGAEKDLEIAYTRAYLGGTLSAIAQMKLDPGHVAGADTQYGAGINWSRAF
jgi:Subtilase family